MSAEEARREVKNGEEGAGVVDLQESSSVV